MCCVVSSFGLIVISGPSLSGKSTIVNYLKNNNYNVIKQYTTRPPRNENDNEYHYVSNKDFYFMSKNMKLCGTRWYYPHVSFGHGPWFYFYLCDDITSDSVLVSDIEGGLKIKSMFKHTHIVCLLVSSNELDRRLKLRGVSAEQVRRLHADKKAYNDTSKCDILFNTETDSASNLLHYK